MVSIGQGQKLLYSPWTSGSIGIGDLGIIRQTKNGIFEEMEIVSLIVV
jgi:hypothetical protein